MNYADIKQFDTANGPGIRVSIFVSGCTHGCKGCFNQEAWDFQYGSPFTQNEIQAILNHLAPDYITGLTILGGEPMEPVNQAGLLPLLQAIRTTYGSRKTIWLFTGYLFDKDIMDRMYDTIPETKELLSYLDVIMDGPFIEELKDLSAYFRGSSNQRGIMVQETLAGNGELILWEPVKPIY